jgi:uncharacterized phiE125 gp8 family phage protein
VIRDVRRVTTTPGAAPPLTADELMSWGRVTDDAERATAERLILVACDELQRYTGIVVLPGTFLVSLSYASRVELPLSPVSAVTAVRTLDEYGVGTLLDVSAYGTLLSVSPALLRVSGSYYGAGLEVLVSAGYADAKDVPEDVRQALLDVALLHYQHRDDPALLDLSRAYLGTLVASFGIVQV